MNSHENQPIRTEFFNTHGHFHLGLLPYPAYRQLRLQNHVVEDIVAFTQLPDVDITAAGTAQVGKAELVSGNFYTQMQVKPQMGRPIEPSDDGAPGAARSPSSATASGIGNSVAPKTYWVKLYE